MDAKQKELARLKAQIDELEADNSAITEAIRSAAGGNGKFPVFADSLLADTVAAIEAGEPGNV